jgi:N-acyl-D-aspartate/D-glutamate deacylase
LTAVPGFIDIHRHGDLVPFGSGEEAEELRQGITFFMNGSCGFSPVPSRGEFFGLLQSYARPIMGAIPDHLRGMDFAAFRRALEQMPLYSNMGCLCGGGALRIAVKGFDNSPMSAAEMDSLSGLLEGELDAGAFGLSLGLMYAPENFYSIEELEKICRIPARRGLPVAVHLWQEGNGLFDSIEKIIALAKKSGAAIHISHLKITGKQNWGKIGRALDRIVCARKEGLDITFDAYPYNAGSTALYALLPPARLNRGPAELIESLREPQMRRAIAAELQDANAAWDNVVPGIGWQGVAISGGRDASLSGLSVRDIAAGRGCSPEDCVFDLLLENDGNISVIIFSMDEADVEKVLGFPGAIVISDSLYAGNLPHPRRFGSQARFLSRYAAALGFEKALCSVTSLPARRFGLKDRGLLRAGAVADIVLLDRALLRDTAVWEAPAQYPQGIARVFVSGKQAFNEQEGPVGKYGRLATYEGAA